MITVPEYELSPRRTPLLDVPRLTEMLSEGRKMFKCRPNTHFDLDQPLGPDEHRPLALVPASGGLCLALELCQLCVRRGF